ncbi:MAG: beta-N-acetylhexosaminidase [bacterium]|nr:beta-N-acetylhexosaminidase [bacterium]MBU1918193.1 beta-N-acetylhexosaminidase [bacterium]
MKKVDRIGQKIIAGFEEKQITPIVRDLILKHKILGFTLFSRNIESKEQVIELNTELKALARQAAYDLVLAVDQEGGRVARLPEPFSQIAPMRAFGDRYKETQSTKEVYELGRTLGREVKEAGFNLNFAPVVDVDVNPDNPIIGDRSFASDSQLVTVLARELIKGMEEEGVQSCLKHFPGHGATTKDSHLELPEDGRTMQELKHTDIKPYHTLIDENCGSSIMTAHVLYPKIDPNYPATLSKTIISDLLRKEMGYQGIIYSDDFLMKAIRDHYDLADAAKRFFEIGGDVILICNEPEVTLEVIQKYRN